MSDLKLDTDGDLAIEMNDLVLTSGEFSIRQHLAMRLRMFFGEWFLNRGLGVPYFQRVFIKNPSVAVLNNVFTSAILNTPGVNSIESLTFSLSNARALTVSFRARTSEGVLNFSEQIEV
jgi:hypothetical protein